MCEASPELSSQNNKGATANRLSKVRIETGAGINQSQCGASLRDSGVLIHGQFVEKWCH